MSAVIWQVIYKKYKILQNFGGIKQIVINLVITYQ